MLTKIMKHEIKATYKYIVMLDVAAIVSTFLLVLMNRAALNISTVGGIIEAILALAYGFLIMAAGFGTFLIPAFRFYKSMFTDEGYLTHTLPVKSFVIIAGKAIVYAIWSVVSVIAILVSVVILIGGTDGWSELSAVAQAFVGFLGVSPLVPVYLIWGIVISVFFGIGSVYVSCAFGNLFGNHKLLASIVSYVVLQFILQIAGTILLAAASIGNLPFYSEEIVVNTAEEAFGAFVPFMTSGLVIMTVLTVLFFWLTNFIVSRKLNLQ